MTLNKQQVLSDIEVTDEFMDKAEQNIDDVLSAETIMCKMSYNTSYVMGMWTT